mmetsp:Transcript_55787/g.118842  ORF Transcript_55787/g.118842 Transcript_55787/m.118842 type:complete len:137 (-) Transcript_55787:723-1133(-)
MERADPSDPPGQSSNLPRAAWIPASSCQATTISRWALGAPLLAMCAPGSPTAATTPLHARESGQSLQVHLSICSPIHLSLCPCVSAALLLCLSARHLPVNLPVFVQSTSTIAGMRVQCQFVVWQGDRSVRFTRPLM